MNHRQMPNTLNGLDPMLCVSALQKCIRRARERQAMEFACELVNSSKQYCTMVCNRLEVISHEDVDAVGHPHVVPFVMTCCRQAREWHNATNPGKSRMAVGSAIRLLCRTPKSREGDHFQAAIGLKSLRHGYRPEIPDEAMDMHTREGKRMGRGIAHFRTEGAKLAGGPPADEYEHEAYAMWAAGDPRKATLFTPKT